MSYNKFEFSGSPWDNDKDDGDGGLADGFDEEDFEDEYDPWDLEDDGDTPWDDEDWDEDDEDWDEDDEDWDEGDDSSYWDAV